MIENDPFLQTLLAFGLAVTFILGIKEYLKMVKTDD